MFYPHVVVVQCNVAHSLGSVQLMMLKMGAGQYAATSLLSSSCLCQLDNCHGSVARRDGKATVNQ